MEETQMAGKPVTAILADDEPLLLGTLQRELSSLWPNLSIVATATNGPAAIDAIMENQPDIVFLDIQMPGATGIEVAEAIADDWPDDPAHKSPPLIVFVTAFDNYAVDAFNTAAIDYLLKPVRSDRLATTVERIQQRLNQSDATDINELGEKIRQILSKQLTATPATGSDTQLRVIRASVGDTVRLIPVDEVILFESADKYVTVHTGQHEALIREPLRKLLPQLDQSQFAQIHRGAIVNLSRVEAAVRDDSGKLTLRLKGLEKQPVVSRVYKHLFQAM